MDEKRENIFNLGWVFTIAFGIVISQAFPNLAKEAALLITLAPIFIVLVFLADGKDAEATKDTQ